MSPAGRRPGSPDTESEILTAARETFAQAGYERATIRGIAATAGVDPALIHHYFGTKEKLYAASIDLPFEASSAIEQAFVGIERSEIGESIARMFFTVWESQDARASLMGILRSALSGEEQAVAAFREYLVQALKSHLAARIDHADAELRALAIAGHLVGLAVVRYVVRIEPLASASVDEIVDLVSPRLQSYLD